MIKIFAKVTKEHDCRDTKKVILCRVVWITFGSGRKSKKIFEADIFQDIFGKMYFSAHHKG
jgi:hypothetical protein